jgi:hypothetical protein
MRQMPAIRLLPKEPVKLEALSKFTSEASPKNLKKLGLAFPKKFKAAVVVDKKGSPRGFVFDTYSLWDLLCAFDETYEAGVSDKKYVYNNPVGWLIDEIESHLPLNPKLAARLKKNIEEAQKTGYIPFKEVAAKLGLA